MHADSPFTIDLRHTAGTEELLCLEASDAYFKSLGDPEILNAEVRVTIRVSGPRAGVYRIAYHVSGTAETPCDRCSATMTMAVDTDDERYVTSYDSDAEPTDEAPLAQRGDRYDLGHDVFETIALARPLGCSHPQGGCEQSAEDYISGSAD